MHVQNWNLCTSKAQKGFGGPCSQTRAGNRAEYNRFVLDVVAAVYSVAAWPAELHSSTMFILAYIPILSLCVLLGLFHAPVSTLFREFTRTLDVPQAYVAVDAVVDYVQECVVFPGEFIYATLIANRTQARNPWQALSLHHPNLRNRL